MIKNIVTQDSLSRAWNKIATKMADQLKQKYYAYYIKEHYAKEIIQINEQKQKYKMNKGVLIIQQQFRYQQSMRRIKKIYKGVCFIQAYWKMLTVREWFI